MRKKILLLWACLCLGTSLAAGEVKNVIWVIGDGMGPELMGFFMQGVRYGNVDSYPNKTSALEEIMNQGTWGLFFNNTYDTIVTDSASAATQMATGALSRPGMIGVDYNGDPAMTFLELAKQKGKAVGVISDSYITDATPAGFTAHVQNRREKMAVARQQIEEGVDVILGGGLKYFNSGENKKLLKQAKKQGYQIVSSKKSLQKVSSGKLLGLFAEESLPMSVELYKYPQIPSLTEQTQKAVELLEKNREGFFLMVEAGKIDWAAHANDAGSVWAEMKVLDAVLAFLKEYADKHSDTLILINADHDTGLGAFQYRHVSGSEIARKSAQGEALYSGDMDYASFSVYKRFEQQKESLYTLRQELKKVPAKKLTKEYLQKRLTEALGYPVDLSGYENVTDIAGLFKQMDIERGLAWATPNHSSAALLNIAYGPEAEHFSGVYHNTDLMPKLRVALDWDEE